MTSAKLKVQFKYDKISEYPETLRPGEYVLKHNVSFSLNKTNERLQFKIAEKHIVERVEQSEIKQIGWPDKCTHNKGKRAYKCGLCYVAFNARPTFKSHMRLHNDFDAPYRCNFCSATFKENPALRQHLKSHTKERRYQCTSCSESFMFSHTLEAHQSRVHKSEASRPSVGGNFLSQETVIQRFSYKPNF